MSFCGRLFILNKPVFRHLSSGIQPCVYKTLLSTGRSFIRRQNIPFEFVVPSCISSSAICLQIFRPISTTMSANGQPANIREKRESGGAFDEGKRLAAFKCVDKHVKSGYAVGIGTGSTAKYAVHRLGEKIRNGELKDIICVPTSFQARQLILENQLTLGDLERNQELDVCIDGADEVDEELNCIKGGGGCLMQEKIVMSCAKYFYIIADSRKMCTRLGDRWTTIPLEVVPMAYAPIKRRIECTEGGQVQLRMATRKVGPVVTDNGNFILDWTFPKYVADHQRTTNEWMELNTRLKMIPGVLETGLFLKYAQGAFFGQQDGTVTEKSANEDRRINQLTNKRPLTPDGITNGNIA